MRPPDKSNQRNRLLALLNARANLWVPLPDILTLRIAQYNARIHELRSLGHHIESKQDGDRSWFRLVDLASTVIPESEVITEKSANPEMLLGGLAAERHRDNG